MKSLNIKNIARVLLGFFLTFAGVSHLTFNRSAFLAQIPEWLPLGKDFTVLASGIVEISLGVSLVFWVKKKRWVGIVVAIFFLLVFPGNIAQYVNKVDAFGLNTDKLRLIRLFFQPVLILWALWSTGVFKKNN
ncbi:putative membrane protein [Pedobacter sp. UYEF25]